jgi:hypothetical protein
VPKDRLSFFSSFHYKPNRMTSISVEDDLDIHYHDSFDVSYYLSESDNMTLCGCNIELSSPADAKPAAPLDRSRRYQSARVGPGVYFNDLLWLCRCATCISLCGGRCLKT